MVLFFCAFLALRSEDTKTPLKKIRDFYVHKEKELFGGSVPANTFSIGDSRPADASSTITTSTPLDCSRIGILMSSDSKLPRKPVPLKGKERKETTLTATVLIPRQDANLDSLHHPSDTLAHLDVTSQFSSGAPRRSPAICLH